MLVTLQPDGFAMVFEDDNESMLRIELVEVRYEPGYGRVVDVIRTVTMEPWHLKDIGEPAFEALIVTLTWITASLGNEYGNAWLYEPIGG